MGNCSASLRTFSMLVCLNTYFDWSSFERGRHGNTSLSDQNQNPNFWAVANVQQKNVAVSCYISPLPTHIHTRTHVHAHKHTHTHTHTHRVLAITNKQCISISSRYCSNTISAYCMSVLNLPLFVYGVVFDMFHCVLGHCQGQHVQHVELLLCINTFPDGGWAQATTCQKLHCKQIKAELIQSCGVHVWCSINHCCKFVQS